MKVIQRELAPRTWGLLSGIISGLCVGVTLYWIHSIAGKVPASEVAFVRAISAVFILLPLAMRHGWTWIGRKSSLLWIRSGLGAVSVLCLIWNLQHTSVGFANTLFNFAPILVVILGYKAGQEKPDAGRFIEVFLVVVASVLFWHASRSHTSVLVWTVGLCGMCSAAISYVMLKELPRAWTSWDITWCLNVVTLPLTFLFKRGPWIAPVGHSGLVLVLICAFGLLGNALAYASFRYLELSTATALVPSSIIWGVLLDMGEHNFPAVQGIAGCLLYLAATIKLAIAPRKNNAVTTMATLGKANGGLGSESMQGTQISPAGTTIE
jgi:drug/metabolite transporter (DMT)-like permease